MNARTLFLSAVTLSMASAAMAQERINMFDSDIDERFHIASERFGDGRVQMHSQREGTNLMINLVSEIDCNARTIRSIFEGRRTPAAFPMAVDRAPGDNIEPGSAEEYLAQHACSRNGLSLADFDR